MASKEEENNKQQPLKQTIKSVAAAFIGVQSESNRVRDFSQGKFVHFAVVGFIFVVLFVLALVAVVSLVMSN